jgi:exodeoxyribonuclease VIII
MTQLEERKSWVDLTLTNEDYHAGPGISKSSLDLVARSPLHYWEKKIGPRKDVAFETASMRLGTLAHLAVLEPDLMAEFCMVAPDVNRRTKVGKAEYAAAEDEAEATGRKLVTANDLLTVQEMRNAVDRHPLAKELLKGGTREGSFFWTDDMTGHLCKCRPDLIDKDRRFAIDLKTTTDASPDSFRRSAAKYRYGVQAAWYSDGADKCLGYDCVDTFVILAVESVPPYGVALYELGQDWIMAGQMMYRRDLETLVRCLESDKWPSYSEHIVPLGMPRWAASSITTDNPDIQNPF